MWTYDLHLGVFPVFPEHVQDCLSLKNTFKEQRDGEQVFKLSIISNIL